MVQDNSMTLYSQDNRYSETNVDLVKVLILAIHESAIR